MRNVMRGIAKQSPEEREKSFAENGYYVIPFDSAGFIGSITIIDTLERARSAQRQLRQAYPSVKVMTREEFLKVQEKEDKERRAWNEYSY